MPLKKQAETILSLPDKHGPRESQCFAMRAVLNLLSSQTGKLSPLPPGVKSRTITATDQTTMPYHLQQHYRHLAAQRSNAKSSAIFKRWLALYACLALALLALVLS